MLGKQLSRSSSNSEVFRSESVAAVKKLTIRGPLYRRGETWFFPFPKDLHCYMEEGELKVSFKCPIGSQSTLRGGFYGTGKYGLHEEELWPVAMPKYGKEWKGIPEYISEPLMIQWLAGSIHEHVIEKMKVLLEQWRDRQGSSGGEIKQAWHERISEAEKHFMEAFAVDRRTHTAIDENTYSSKDEALFEVESVVVPSDVSLLAEVQWPEQGLEWPERLSVIHSLGGKRRLAHFQEWEGPSFGSCPEEISKALDQRKYVRMVLVTPAYFAKGWRPGWLDEKLETNEKWPYGVKLKLRWACVPGWLPISGWSYSNNRNGSGREKAVRRMVPAGSVYFFEVKDGNPRDLAEKGWLATVSDKDRRKGTFDAEDGFGLAIWGAWQPLCEKLVEETERVARN
jgi:CRISPR-associated protein Cmr3